MAHWLPSSNLMSSNNNYAVCRETQLTNRTSGIIWMIHIHNCTTDRVWGCALCKSRSFLPGQNHVLPLLWLLPNPWWKEGEVPNRNLFQYPGK